MAGSFWVSEVCEGQTCKNQKSIKCVREMELLSFHSQILPFKCSSPTNSSVKDGRISSLSFISRDRQEHSSQVVFLRHNELMPLVMQKTAQNPFLLECFARRHQLKANLYTLEH